MFKWLKKFTDWFAMVSCQNEKAFQVGFYRGIFSLGLFLFTVFIIRVDDGNDFMCSRHQAGKEL